MDSPAAKLQFRVKISENGKALDRHLTIKSDIVALYDGKAAVILHTPACSLRAFPDSVDESPPGLAIQTAEKNFELKFESTEDRDVAHKEIARIAASDTIAGVIKKKSPSGLHPWQSRLSVYVDGNIRYWPDYKSLASEQGPRGWIQLSPDNSELVGVNANFFSIQVQQDKQKRIFEFQCPSASLADAWTSKIRKFLTRKLEAQPAAATASSGASSAESRGSCRIVLSDAEHQALDASVNATSTTIVEESEGNEDTPLTLALGQLQVAMDEQAPEAIATAIQVVRDEGGSDGHVAAAAEKLKCLADIDTTKATLLCAVADRNLRPLKEAVDRFFELSRMCSYNFSKCTEIKKAEKLLMFLIQATQPCKTPAEASFNLKAAMEGKNAALLSQCITRAQEHELELPEGMLDKARSLLRSLESLEAALQDLEACLFQDDSKEIRSVLDLVKQSGKKLKIPVQHLQIVNEAENYFKAESKMAEALDSLEEALTCDDTVRLQECLIDALALETSERLVKALECACHRLKEAGVDVTEYEKATARATKELQMWQEIMAASDK